MNREEIDIFFSIRTNYVGSKDCVKYFFFLLKM